ncbi:MAG: T9SS type A sorting domain-containing protein [Bacteroidetes bacterium]|nr:MAG: T9SS type A sorting domain-containing protein [Bacteroidota bacterium]
MKNFIKFIFFLIIFSLVHQINLFSQYSYVLQWGAYGTNDGQFNSAYDVGCDTSGHVYVTDRYNHRVQKFTASGQYLLQWGTLGTDNGEFNSPHGISTDFEGRIEIADLENNRIQRFTALGVYLMKFSSQNAADIAVDNSGNYYVTDYALCKVTKYDPAGNEITHWGNLGLGNGQFQNPHGIAVDNAGNVYVVDQNNNRIQKFNSNGLFIKKWGVAGSGSGQLNLPLGIAIDKNNDVFISDFGNNRIQKFDSAGNYKTQWGQLGSADGKFDGPTGVAVDTNGFVYVADYNNFRVQKFEWKNLTITTTNFNGTFCKGAGLNVAFITNDQFNTSNTFIAQLSNSSGDFTNPIVIGQLIGTGSGTVQCAIPSNINAGSGYRIRIIGNEPYVEGTDNGTNIIITQGPNPVFVEEATNVCEDVPGNVYTVGVYNSYQWSYTGIPGYDYIVTSGGTSLSNSTTVTWLTTGTRFVQVEVTGANGCKGIVTSSVLVKDKPQFDFTSSSTITCVGQSIEFGTLSTYPNYSWSFSGVQDVDFIINGGASSTMSSTTVTWLSPGLQTAQLEVTSEIGCKNAKVINLQINPVPIPSFSEKIDTACSGENGIVYTTSSTFSTYIWNFSGVQGTDYIIEAGAGSSDNSTTMTWLTQGNKFVKVGVTNDNGCSNEIQADVFVKQSPIPVFDNPRASICQGEFWNLSTTTTFTSYSWTIPGTEGIDYYKNSGGTTIDNDVIIYWLTAGKRTVKLIVFSDNGCSKEINIEVNVYRNPVPLIYGELNPCQFVTETYTTENDVGTLSVWNAVGGDVISQNNDSLIIKWETSGQGILKLVQTSLHGCIDSIIKIINVKAMPDVTLQQFPDACINDSSYILTGGSPDGGVYSGEGVINGIFIPSVAGIGEHEITYTYLHNNGCFNIAKQNLTVNPHPMKPTIERIGNTLASSSPTGNQWFMNGLKMQGETKQFLNLKELGFYQVRVIDFNGCISELSNIMQVDVLGIEKFPNEYNIVVYPNPADDFINIIFKNINESNAEIKILNLLGETLEQNKFYINDFNYLISFNTHFLKSGIYILSIGFGNNVNYYKIFKN